MTPPFDKPTDACIDRALVGRRTEDLNAPENLARATAKLRAMGIDDDEIVFATRNPEELFAYLDATASSCARST